jgi:hypothetical protein
VILMRPEMKSGFLLRLLLLAAGGHGAIALEQSQGAFAPTGDMSTERTGHTATLLTNGKVLIAGGSAILVGWPVWASAELYDPFTGAFTLTGSMTTPRAGHTATLLPDGKVLIAGGDSQAGLPSGASAQASAELYDPVTGAFNPTGDMLAARSGHTATLLNTGKVLITGGESTAPADQSSAELYDPLTGTFTATGSMTAARSFHVAVLLPNSRVFIAGGANCGPQPNPELYDPAIGQFTLTSPSAYPPASGLSTVSASLLPSGNVLSILIVGCDVGSGAEVYDSANGTFTATVGRTIPTLDNTATLLPEGRVLIAGMDYFPDGSAELYEPVNDAFTPVDGTFPQRESAHTATLLPDGSVLLAGGWICCGSSLSTAAIYHPAHPAPSPVLYSLAGGAQGAILHAGTHEVVSPANPAVNGEALEIYGVGLIDSGAIPPQVSIGGRLADVLFFGNAPGFLGLNQVNVRVPSGVTGASLPVRLNYLNRPSNEITLAVK